MKHYGIENAEGGSIKNLVAPSGTADPANPDPGELYFRTDTNELEFYNGTAWTSVQEPSWPLLAPSSTGSPQTPQYSFEDEPDTGWMRNDSQTVQLNIAGQESFRIVRPGGDNGPALGSPYDLANIGIDFHILNDALGDSQVRIETNAANKNALLHLITASSTWKLQNDSADDGLKFLLADTAQVQFGSDGAIELTDTTAPGTTTNKLYSVGGTLYWNGTDLTAGGISNVVEDTTPQLGGALDLNGNVINTSETAGAVDISAGDGTSGFAGHVYLRSGDATTGFAGYIRFIPGKNSSDVPGYVQVEAQFGSTGPAPQFRLSDGAANFTIALKAPDTLSESVIYTLPTLPTGSPFPTQFLTTNESGVLSWASAGGISNVVEDTTPQLGGNLDMNANDIIMPSGSSIEGNPNVVINGADTGTTFGGNILGTAGDGTTLGGGIDFRAGNAPSGPGNIDLNVGYGTTSNTTGVVRVRSLGGTEAAKLEFREKVTGGSSNWIRLKAPDDTNNNRTWVLPQDDPATAAGQFLTTDASGVLSFADAATDPAGSNQHIQYNDNGAFGASANLLWDGNGIQVGGAGQTKLSNGVLGRSGNMVITAGSQGFFTTRSYVQVVNNGGLNLHASDGSIIASNFAGQNVFVEAGDGDGTGDGGDIVLKPGLGGTGSPAGASGAVIIYESDGTTPSLKSDDDRIVIYGPNGPLTTPPNYGANDVLVLEDNSGGTNISLWAPTGAQSAIKFGQDGVDWGGRILFNHDGTGSPLERKGEMTFTVDGTNAGFVIEADRTLTVGSTANYETLVTSDDDIPNKKYVDDAIGRDLGEFTVAGLPAASSYPNYWALATDASGGRTIVRSDGTNWKVVAVEGATVA